MIVSQYLTSYLTLKDRMILCTHWFFDWWTRLTFDM